MQGRCACGSVSLTLARRPEQINQCDCSVCLRLGAAWAYFAAEEAEVAGSTAAYTRTDLPDPYIAFHFCLNCGSTTHWAGLEEGPAAGRRGINMRLFEPDELDGIEVRFSDGLRRELHGARLPDRHPPIIVRDRWPT